MLAQRPHHDLVERLGNIEVWTPLSQARRRLALVKLEELATRARYDGKLAGQGFVHEHPERVEVGAGLDRRADALLGRHVLRRSERVALLRQALGSRELRHAEVEHLRGSIVAQKNIARLEIAVNDALLVRGAERPAHLDENRQRESWRDDARAGELVGQADAAQKLHDDVDAAVGHLVEVEGADDVGVLDRDLHLGFPAKPRDLACILGRGAAQDLDGDLRTQGDVLGRVDDADAARANLARDAILSAEGRAREIAGRGRRFAPQRQTSFERRDSVPVERACGAIAVQPIRKGADDTAERRADARGDAHRETAARERDRARRNRGARACRKIRAPR